MTPTEQYKELADTIFQHLDGLSAVVSINHTTNRKGYAERRKRDDFIVYKTRDELLRLITADRKRVALEARIDEINYLDDNFQADSQDWEREHPGFSTAMIPMEDYIRRRAELKAQQEEL